MNQLKFIYLFTLFSSFYNPAIAASIAAHPVHSVNTSDIKNISQSKDTQNYNQIQQIESSPIKTNFFEQNRDLIIKFIKQPYFTKPSIKCFFRHTFNNPYYADKYLPFDMSHIITFSSFASQTLKPREYLLNALSLFKQKIFFSRVTNGYEFEGFLRNFIEIIAKFFDAQNEKEERISKIKERLYFLLYDDFERLKANPEKILDETAASIDLITNCSIHKTTEDIDISVYDLQYAVFTLFQACLVKLIWNPHGDTTALWDSIKSISLLLEECLRKNILPSRNHLNDLLWALIASFNYLIESWGHILPESFYENILEEINTKPLCLWTLKENDPLTLPKFRHLVYLINQGIMRSKLHQQRANLMPITPT